MHRLFYRTVILWAILLLAVLLISCGGGGSTSSGDSNPESLEGTGTLEIFITDAATEHYQAIYVTIAEVQVHKAADAEDDDSGWQTILSPDKTYNLLELVNGVFETIGIAELAEGKYNQMRLILGAQPDDSFNILDEPHPYANYLIDSEEEYQELKVPSGFNTGIKIVKGFTIEASQATELILDFDAARSVVQAGKSGKYQLKPTIKVLETVQNSVGGVVDDGVDPIEGALVSAQVYDNGAVDPKDKVIVKTTTVSTEEGAYKLFLPPDIYNIVVTMDGYLPACHKVEAQFYEEYTADFSLDVAGPSGTVAGTVSGLVGDDSFATLSFRQILDCGIGPEMVEVRSLNIGEGGDYTVTLPTGVYQIVATAGGEAIPEITIMAADGTETPQDIKF